MKVISTECVAAVSGGDSYTREWGRWVGVAAGELQAHPEAMLLGPLGAYIYISVVCEH